VWTGPEAGYSKKLILCCKVSSWSFLGRSSWEPVSS